MMTRTIACVATLAFTAPAWAQTNTVQPTDDDTPASSSLLLAHTPIAVPTDKNEPHALRDASLFAITPPDPKRFERHDLVQVIVREQSRATREQQLEADKAWQMAGQVAQMAYFRPDQLPSMDLRFDKQFDGDAEYQRRDELSDRLTAEVIEVLPNGNLVLEARTSIQTDEEISVMCLTGICRPDDITGTNTILSTQIHDLKVERINSGDLKKSNEKGILAKALEFVFAF